MTIVMEEDAFNTSLSSLATLSPSSPQQINNNSYQTLINTSDNLSTSSAQSGSSPNSQIINENSPYALFLFRSNY